MVGDSGGSVSIDGLETTIMVTTNKTCASQESTGTIPHKATTSTSTSQFQPVSVPTRPPSVHAPRGPVPPLKPASYTGDRFDLDSLLFSGEVLLVCDNFQSLEIPPQIRTSFWEEKEIPPRMLKQLEMDLDWPIS